MDNEIIEMETVARRLNTNRNALTQLTVVDWIVLDFTDGKRSFKDLAYTLPTEQSALMASYRHLKALGLITWNNSAHDSSISHDPHENTSPGFKRVATHTFASVEVNLDLCAAIADLSDELCLQYIPRSLLGSFRSFTPKIADSNYEIELGIQALIEFLSVHIASLTPYEILGVEPNADAATIRQAYLKRSRLFHPDRYFRKNIGVFSSHLSSLFKAVTKAFGALQ